MAVHGLLTLEIICLKGERNKQTVIREDPIGGALNLALWVLRETLPIKTPATVRNFKEFQGATVAWHPCLVELCVCVCATSRSTND